MISGRVELTGFIADHPILEPRIAVAVAGPDRVFRTVECTVDTGFTGWLALPSGIIRQLGLQYRGRRDVRLANGQEQITPIYLALISWYDQIIPRLVHQSNSSPLVGMGLLTGYFLTVEAVAGGSVIIEELLPGQ